MREHSHPERGRTEGKVRESVAIPAEVPGPQRPVRRLDRKLSTIAAGRYTPGDFVIADAKEAASGPGLPAAGRVTGGPPGADRSRARRQYLDAMRDLVA